MRHWATAKALIGRPAARAIRPHPLVQVLGSRAVCVRTDKTRGFPVKRRVGAVLRVSPGRGILMGTDRAAALSTIREESRLAALPCLVDLKTLAKNWGVTAIEEREIGSAAMLLPNREGYSIVLKTVDQPSRERRQRFSFAHELGHLLLWHSGQVASGTVPVAPDSRSGGINLREVPAEAMAWGRGDYKQGFTYYSRPTMLPAPIITVRRNHDNV